MKKFKEMPIWRVLVLPNSWSKVRWDGLYNQSGNSITVINKNWNVSIGVNGTTSFGFQASYSGSNNTPPTFTLNGESCSVN
jgi:hypothetical protein